MSQDKTDGVAVFPTHASEAFEEGKLQTADKALDVAAGYASYLGDEGYSAKEERSLMWKLDLRLIPILWLNVCFAAMDKVSTSTAAIYGMIDDTGLTGNKYSWVGSVFYVSFSRLVASTCVPGLTVMST